MSIKAFTISPVYEVSLFGKIIRVAVLRGFISVSLIFNQFLRFRRIFSRLWINSLHMASYRCIVNIVVQLHSRLYSCLTEAGVQFQLCHCSMFTLLSDATFRVLFCVEYEYEIWIMDKVAVKSRMYVLHGVWIQKQKI